MKKLNPYEASQAKLYFLNLLNQAGSKKEAIKYSTVAEAEKLSAPILKRIMSKLTPEEINFLNERIEHIQ